MAIYQAFAAPASTMGSTMGMHTLFLPHAHGFLLEPVKVNWTMSATTLEYEFEVGTIDIADHHRATFIGTGFVSGYVLGMLGGFEIEHRAPIGGTYTAIETYYAYEDAFSSTPYIPPILTGRLTGVTANLADVASAQHPAVVLAGDDFLYGASGNDVLFGLGGGDLLVGVLGDDDLDGGDGDDIIEGGAGRNTLRGGAGNDIYKIESSSDVVIEAASAGSDILRLLVDYRLTEAMEIEHVEILAATAVSFSGNSYATEIVGNGVGSVLGGGGGGDTYVFYNGVDFILEAVDQGGDTLKTAVSYVLADDVYVEVIEVFGTSPLNISGNLHGNILYGNGTGSKLDGGGGADTLFGSKGDVLRGGIGADRFLPGLGGVTIDGGADADLIDFRNFGTTQ